MIRVDRRLLAVALVLAGASLFWVWKRQLGRGPAFPVSAYPMPSFTSDSCRRSYERFYASDSIDLRMAFGYKDARPARFVGDRYERADFVQEILKPCLPASGACGFVRSKEDADLFTRPLRGPDGKLKTIRLRVVSGSAGVDDEVNRGNPFQKWQSEYARTSFLEGLERADAVFYDGHSRSGGGPDFDPPHLTHSLKVDMPWYRRATPGLKEMEEAFAKGGPGTKLLALFSCDSSPLFAPRVAGMRKGMGVVASDQLIYYADALQGSLAALSALLEMKCQPDFNLALKTKASQAGAKLTGFFKN